jgi:hypothetical protein
MAGNVIEPHQPALGVTPAALNAEMNRATGDLIVAVIDAPILSKPTSTKPS